MLMRIALLLCFLFQAGAGAFGQTITLSEKNIHLSKVFSAIQQQSGLSLLYDNKLIAGAKNININVKNASLEEVLDYCLKNLPLTYVITDKIIIIKEKPVQDNPKPAAQIIRGTIRDEEQNRLEGASVTLKELKKSTESSESGDFLFENIPRGTYTIEISFIGYEKLLKTITIADNEASFSFLLKKTYSNLNELTITALGISRKSRTLSYATQTVPGNELTTVKNSNVLNSLNGRVAGAQINRTSGGAGGSVRIVLRGDKSTRNSQPLYVVDGLPIINPVGGPTSGLYNGAPDAGDIISTLNPDDIESISILKGASASALYGSQGSNGVILITTKKGKSGSTKLDFSSSVTFDRVNVLPQLQYDYHQTTPATPTVPGSTDSWGTKGTTLPSKDYVKDFFQTGVSFINSISLSSGNEKSSNYLSYSNTDNKGILPTSTFRQNTLAFRQSSKLFNGRLIFDGNFLGSIQKTHNRLTPGVYFNPLPGLYLFPRGLDFDSYKNYEYFSPLRYLNAQNWWNINYDKNQASGGWGGQDYQQNPYWVLNRNLTDNKTQNGYASLTVKYLLNNWLSLQARGNINNVIAEFQRRVYATTQATLSRPNGNLFTRRSDNTTLYGDLLLLGNRDFNETWNLNFTLGSSIQDQKGKALSIIGEPAVPNVFLESALDIRNSPTAIVNTAVSRQVQSVFGTVQLGYKNKLFLDFTDRNDWSSTLAFTPSEKKGFNYYSVGASVVLSELLNLPSINFARLRASYAIVGNDIAAFSTYPIYTFNGGIAIPPVSSPINIPGYYLQPEKNKSFEIGAQSSLLNGRMSLDITWYKSNIIRQYFSGIAVPPSLGTGGFADINSGNIQNSGIELMASSKPILTDRFSWTTTINASKNRNKIIELFDPQIVANPSPDDIYLLSGGNGEAGALKLGGSYNDIYGRAFMRDSKGKIIVNSSTGLPLFTSLKHLGNPNPKIILGWKNSFDWKNLSLSFLIDGKFGGKVLSITEAYLDQAGVSKRTGDIRNAGATIFIENAVDENGNEWKGATDAAEYYKKISGKTPVAEAYMFSATAIRLREFSAVYRLPLYGKAVKELRAGLIGSNLFFFKRKAPFDPEQVAGVNPGGVGIDTFGLPSYRSLGFVIQGTF